MILTMVWDGLRPDMITPERTPFLYRRSTGGVTCRRSHAVYPTATRINSASLATGCYPGQHGIVDNELYIPSVDRWQATSCADWRALQQMADQEGGPLLTVPTLGEIVHKAGKVMASAGSGSPGTTFLTNPTLSGPIVNWALAWPQEVEAQLAQVGMPMLDERSTSTERNRFVIDAINNLLLPHYRPDALTVWFTEPDHAQHADGLASEATLAMLRELDADVEGLVKSVEAFYGADQVTCFVISDHGFSTIAEQVDPVSVLADAGFSMASEGQEGIVWAMSSLYLDQASRARIGDLAACLLAQPWISGVFVRDDLAEACPGVMRQSEVGGGHARSAELMFSYRWSDEPNAFGIPGSVVFPSSIAAIHGSSSPWTLNNTLVGWGAGLKKATVSSVPCGIVDIAPTILHLLGIPAPDVMQGRVLEELLADGIDPMHVEVVHTEKRSAIAGKAKRCQTARFSQSLGRPLFGPGADRALRRLAFPRNHKQRARE